MQQVAAIEMADMKARAQRSQCVTTQSQSLILPKATKDRQALLDLAPNAISLIAYTKDDDPSLSADTPGSWAAVAAGYFAPADHPEGR